MRETGKLFGLPIPGENLILLEGGFKIVSDMSLKEQNCSSSYILLNIQAGSLPEPEQSKKLCQTFQFYLVDKVNDFRLHFSSSLRICLDLPPSCVSISPHKSGNCDFSHLNVLCIEDLNKIVLKLWTTTCSLDPWPSSFMKGCF